MPPKSYEYLSGLENNKLKERTLSFFLSLSRNLVWQAYAPKLEWLGSLLYEKGLGLFITGHGNVLNSPFSGSRDCVSDPRARLLKRCWSQMSWLLPSRTHRTLGQLSSGAPGKHWAFVAVSWTPGGRYRTQMLPGVESTMCHLCASTGSRHISIGLAASPRDRAISLQISFKFWT